MRNQMTAETARSFSQFSVRNAALAKALLACSCQPYEDVFTYRRWQAQGYQVRRGEHGIRLLVLVAGTVTEHEDGTGTEVTRTIRMRRTSAVFCRHQVEARS